MRLRSTLALLLALTAVAFVEADSVVDTSASPHVLLRGVPMMDVKWTTGLWAEKFALCRDVMIPSMHSALRDPRNAAQLSRFRVVAGLDEKGGGGTDWADGDCYKWLETMAHVYAVTRDPELDRLLDHWIAIIGKAQDADGYISTNIGCNKEGRLQLPYRHEMYNMGHLFTAACIHHRATGKDSFLSLARKLADYLYSRFVPCPPELVHFGWNPSQIMGLMELYRSTREPRYLELARTFVDNRGTVPGKDHRRGGTDQTQDRIPLRLESEAVGHAVCGTYLYCGAADLCAEIGDPKLLAALERLWTNVAMHKMDITGGVAYGLVKSPRGDECHEAFGAKYQLPNQYNETCANIGFGMFSWRMLALTGDAKYADMMETVIYNSLLSAVDLEGTGYFYCNPLVWRGQPDRGHLTNTRWSIHNCYCCPPQVARTIAKLHGWVYSRSDNQLWVHLYGGSALKTELSDGTPFELVQETDYPWNGQVKLTVRRAGPEPLAMHLRIPGWTDTPRAAVNGRSVEHSVEPRTYLTIRRRWSPGDTVALTFPMSVRLMEAHPSVKNLRGYVAVQRGPLVYCLELPKAEEGERIWGAGVYLPENIELTPRRREGLLGKAVVLEGHALTSQGRDQFRRAVAAVSPPPLPEEEDHRLYRPFRPRPVARPKAGTVPISLIPYFAWGNRGRSFMEVWIPLAR